MKIDIKTVGTIKVDTQGEHVDYKLEISEIKDRGLAKRIAEAIDAKVVEENNKYTVVKELIKENSNLVETFERVMQAKQEYYEQLCIKDEEDIIFVNRKVERIPDKIKSSKLALEAEIYTDERGYFVLEINAISYDRFTSKVFTKDIEKGTYSLRAIKENLVYPTMEELEKNNLQVTNHYREEFPTYEEAEKRLEEIISKLAEIRNKMRDKNRYKFVTVLI